MKRITILGGIAFFFVLLVVTSALGIIASMLTSAEHPGLLVQLLMQITLMAVTYPFLVGFLMLGIRQAADLPISFETPFSYLGHAVPVVLAAIMLTVLTTIGFMLLVIPGIYLSVAYLFALPLVVEKGLEPWAALETSRRAVTTHWFSIFAVVIVFSILLLAGVMTIVGWIWTLPLWYAGYGVLYREIFGVEPATGSAT